MQNQELSCESLQQHRMTYVSLNAMQCSYFMQRPQNLRLLSVKLEGLFSPKKRWGHDGGTKYADGLLSSIDLIFFTADILT